MSILGLIHGVLSLYGLVQGWEYIIWLVVALISIIALIVKVQHRVFLNGFLMGLGITLLTGLPQAFFLDMYLEANPAYVDQLDPDRNYAVFILTFIPVFGSGYGLLIGTLGLVIKRLSGPKKGD